MKEITSKTISTGDIYSRLTVLGVYRDEESKRIYARVQCSCGSTVRYVRTDGLKNGSSKSCGCLQIESVTKHGLWGDKIFKVWKSMINRCTNPKDKRFSRYGGRGISVCSRWLNPQHFIDDMSQGYESGKSIERIDNDKNYDPTNCRWATTKQQTRNYSRNLVLEYQGKSQCATDWAAEVGISAKVICDRITRGWTTEKALTKPVMDSQSSAKHALKARWS